MDLSSHGMVHSWASNSHQVSSIWNGVHVTSGAGVILGALMPNGSTSSDFAVHSGPTRDLAPDL